MENDTKTTQTHFIKEIIQEDLKNNKHGGKIITRFPPEPNGYLHIGHAKSVCLNFGLAQEFNGKCNLRFDDTNPEKEEQEYIDAIKRDVQWLGFSWGNREYYASDYFEKMYEWALMLIKKGKAYVDDQNAEQIRLARGTLTEPGKNSPYRDRSVEENLALFIAMKEGKFNEGEKVLRAKIDMASPNLNMRDPVMYRILKASHPRTGNIWCLYPMYDWAHGLEDSIEGITHSICTLEFEDHRPLYDWFLDELDVYHPRQYEFARLNVTFAVMSKRKLLKLVQEKHVRGWDDPRMPTIAGLRRRGFTPEAIRKFCDVIGVSKSNSMVEYALLEHCLRNDLNKRAPRVMAVLKPLKVIITNYPEKKIEELDVDNNPEDPSMGKRTIPFSREIYIDQDDFQEVPHKQFFRLAPGREVRLVNAYYIKCEEIIKNGNTITELHCTYDQNSRGGWTSDGRKVKGTIHWVSASHALPVEVRLYEQLFTKENPETVQEGKDFTEHLNPNSLQILSLCLVEPNLISAQVGNFYQFMRVGYFCVDKDSNNTKLVFNRSVSLKDSWAKVVK